MAFNYESVLHHMVGIGGSNEEEIFRVGDLPARLNSGTVPEQVPILPLRNTVLFPSIVMPISIGRSSSMKAVREAYESHMYVGTITQKDPEVDKPGFADLHEVGTLAQILKIVEHNDGSSSVLLQGKDRFTVAKALETKPFLLAEVKTREDVLPQEGDKEFEAMLATMKNLAIRIVKISPNIPQEAAGAIKSIDNPKFLVRFIASNIDIPIEDKQALLEVDDFKLKSEMLLRHLSFELQKTELQNDIQTKVRTELDQQQREYILQQQIKTIRDELGESGPDQDIDELSARAEKKRWSKKVGEHFYKELDKLERLNPASPDYSNQLNYLETLLDLPWDEYTQDNFDLKKAQRILDKDHFGLTEVKERILEHLAVLKLKGDLKAPILCMNGPPGVGKTSLGKSIAEALGREYLRMSLGGLHDEAEIRGHRKTYIGAMPGRILQSLRKSKSSNPVFILDEIDKIGDDFRGNPAFALLEVLDPEQNESFYDNFLELEYDLSKVMFIATANSLASVHPALLDRMEIIDVSGYVIEEKIEIAKKHLVPKQLKAHGVKKSQFRLAKKALELLVSEYTRESGVRQLDKTLAKVVRSVAKKIGMEEDFSPSIGAEQVRAILGPAKFPRDKYENNHDAGVVTGLAWTAAGGEILFVESSLSRGSGKLTLTGNLGEVMKESAVIALEYVKSNAERLGIVPEAFDHWNIHIHVPEGAIPKDGPSAGITLATSLASIFTQRKVRGRMAMTGELTLRGKVLPVGGIKEKILAAKRADFTDLVLSRQNQKDVEQIEPLYVAGLTFHYVDKLDQVLEFALLDEKVDKALVVV